MAQNDNTTIFQRLGSAFRGNNSQSVSQAIAVSPHGYASNDVLFSTNDRNEYERKLKSFKQQKYLSYQWKKAVADNAMDNLASYNAIKLMYRDADLMCNDTEIGTACEIISEEACPISAKGKMLNIYSKSPRVKSILEDLFVNRLHIYTELPLIAHDLIKYGNEFQLLNIDKDNGIMGWVMLPVYEMDRVENGYTATYMNGMMTPQSDITEDEVKFVRRGTAGEEIFQNWQVAHFRLLKDSIFLPYGCIVGDSRIETSDGYKEIKNISIGDKVVTFSPTTQVKEIADVTMAMAKGVKPVYKVATFHNEIEGTSDHKLLCYDNNILQYKEIKDVNVGDLLVIDNEYNKQNLRIKIDKSNPTSDECSLINHNQMWWTEGIKYIPDYVDEKFARFFGFMIGDGWVSYNKEIYFATGVYDSLNHEFMSYLKEITGKEPKFIHSKYDKDKYVQIKVNSKTLAIILKRMGFYGHFNEKRIPSWVYSCNDTIKKAFLSGLMTADGSYNIDKYGVMRCNIEMSNEQLIKDIKTLVQSLGYKSSKVSCRDRIGKTNLLKNGRTITIRNTSYYFYYYESLNTQEKKYDLKDRKGSGFKTEKVRIKEYVGEKETYDITVSNNNSNFFANGIVTHNCSLLHKARRAWRMWSMMEDAMLVWRLDKAVERRVFKIYVGGIDDQDVPAYINDVANEFKRTQIIDPKTGQVDLRKNFLDVSKDFFIPVRREDAPNPIETLQGANSQVQMEDIEYMQNKIFAAMRVPKTFLNFQEAQGKGQNLALMDVRFSRMVNTIQQFLLMELNQVAMIHLYTLGLKDEIGNFTLSLNNPSSQIEAQELDDMTKRLNAMQIAVTDPGIGIPMMSLHKALREIMKMSDSDIKDMLNEIRLEKAMAAELAATANIIKKTGIFDTVDRIYGDYDAMNSDQPQGGAQQQGDDGGMGGAMGGGAPMGGDMGGMDDMDMDMGEPGSEGGSDMGGEMGETDMSGAPDADAGTPLSENKQKSVMTENKIKKHSTKSFISQYFDMLQEGINKEEEIEEVFDWDGKNISMQEQINKLFNKVDSLVNEDAIERENILNEATEAAMVMDTLSGDTENLSDKELAEIELDNALEDVDDEEFDDESNE